LAKARARRRTAAGVDLEESATVTMPRPGPLHRFRLTLAVRMAATCLIMLTILPFTAPFSVFDLAEVTENGSSHDGGAGAKQSKDFGPPLIVTTTISVDVPVAAIAPVHLCPRTTLFVPAFVVLRV
jgi:hypothetical protein